MKTVAYIVVLWLSVMAAFNVSAAPQNNAEREQWMAEMRQYKRMYFVKELDLTSEQKNKFFPLYEEMEDKVMKINDDTRAMEKRVAELPNATDLEYEKATEAIYDAQIKCAETEKEYMEKFSGILTPKQLFRLKAVERQFNRELMKQHHRLRNKGKAADKPKGNKPKGGDKNKD